MRKSREIWGKWVFQNLIYIIGKPVSYSFCPGIVLRSHIYGTMQNLKSKIAKFDHLKVLKHQKLHSGRGRLF